MTRPVATDNLFTKALKPLNVYTEAGEMAALPEDSGSIPSTQVIPTTLFWPLMALHAHGVHTRTHARTQARKKNAHKQNKILFLKRPALTNILVATEGETDTAPSVDKMSPKPF